MKSIREACIDFNDLKLGNEPDDLRDCRVSEFGEFGRMGGKTYYYALYCLIPNYTEEATCGDGSFTADNYRERALAVFTKVPSDTIPRLFLVRVDPDVGILRYEKPRIVETSGMTILHVPIVVDGTGVGNRSDYLLWENGNWVPIESESWLKDLERRIPNNLRILKGVWPDLQTMHAETGLYKEGDPNCCPSGGTVGIRLSIRARQFVVEGILISK